MVTKRDGIARLEGRIAMKVNPRQDADPRADARDADADSLRAIAEALRGLQFGSVTVIVQDGVVIQVDRTEKRRLARRP